jgi:hypothetical protein
MKGRLVLMLVLTLHWAQAAVGGDLVLYPEAPPPYDQAFA